MVNYNSDIWKIPCKDKSLYNFYKFDFTYIKTETLKNQFKTYIFAGIKREFLEISTLHKYSYYFTKFINFLEENKIKINYFSDLTGDIIDRFIIYLKSICSSSSTMILSYTALKQSVRYGQNLGLDLYPIKEIFPLETARIFGQEDTFKTRLFSDDVAFQIENAIDKEEDIYLKTLLMIAYETGLRISEILNIETNSVIRDFTGNPLLFTVSFKSKTERCVLLTDKCANQIEFLEKYTSEIAIDNKIFTQKYKTKSEYTVYQQNRARQDLQKFLIRNNIIDETGNIAYVIFHGFRHHVGTTYLNSGASADETRISLGHKSLHSTNLYAKMKPKTLLRAYKKIGFIGVSEDDLQQNIEESKVIIEKQKVIEGSLPDGLCLKAFKGENHCEKFNVCLLCSKFRTTINDLPTHIKHLERIKGDKKRYMDEMSIGNIEYVEKIETALKTIIERLEAIRNEKC